MLKALCLVVAFVFLGPEPSATASVSQEGACCKICHKGKACGDSCIARDRVCRQPPGCACDG